jgi:hypothetical protein
MNNKYPSWFIGVIAGLDEEQNIKQTKAGVRYRVRRFGIDALNEPVDKLLMFDCILPLTAGAGDNKKAKSVVLSDGDLVFGMHTDAPDHQRGVIIGVFPRTALINYDEFVKTADLPTASGGDQSELAQPIQLNRGRKIEELTAETDEEKSAIKEVKKATGTNKNKPVKALNEKGEEVKAGTTSYDPTENNGIPSITEEDWEKIDSCYDPTCTKEFKQTAARAALRAGLISTQEFLSYNPASTENIK